MIRLVGSILALIALFRLWNSSHKILWWIILVLFILDWLTGETVKTATKNSSEGDVIRFWVWANMIISISCFLLSVFGIILSFY